MPRVKYDVRGVETGARTVLPAGVYNAKITQADVTKPEGKDQRIELVLEVNEGDHKGAKLYEYINLESEAAKWKFRELLEAAQVVVDGAKETGTLDTDRDLKGRVIGVKTFVRPADDARGFDEQSRVRRMFAVDGAESSVEVEDLDDEEPEAAAEPDELDLDAMSRAELKKLIKDEGLDIKVLRSMSDDDLREAVDEALGEEEPAEEEEPEEEAEEEPAAEAPDDYDEWDDSDLKEELAQRDLSDKGSTKTLIARLRKDDAEEDKPF